jgi:hypothetical protein
MSGLAFWIDGKGPYQGSISFEQDWIDVSTMTESRPDPGWIFTDAAGHFHAFAEDGDLPTLKSVTINVPCAGGCGEVEDGDCGGYDDSEYRCRLCAEVVTPKYDITYPPPKRAPGLKRWTAEVATVLDGNGEVSIVADMADITYFGFAAPVRINDSSTDLVLHRMGRRKRL